MNERKKMARLPGFMAETIKSLLAGLLVFVMMVWLAVRPVQATVESRLPERDITITGRVVAPGCNARLDTDNGMVKFSMNQGGARGTTEKRAEDNVRHLTLKISDCDVDEVGMTFKAETVLGHPARGALRGKGYNELSTNLYYTVGTASAALAPESATMEKGAENEDYFLLDGKTYWLNSGAFLRAEKELHVPIDVRIHTIGACETVPDQTEGFFTLELSWR